LPFCAAKCHYCDFFSVPAEGHDLDGMVEAILREARGRAPRRPATVFLGGGTPSLLSIPLLERLLNGLEERTGFRDSAVEVSCECNPESLDLDKVRALLDLGVTRLSIGVQSLDAVSLELFGRVHDPEQGLRAIETARRGGVRELGVDLIHGAPGQAPDQWAQELERVLDLGVEHLSAYGLTYEPGTRFAAWRDEGRLRPVGEEVELELLRLTRERATAAGLPAYEISNHARPGHECRHNLGYWCNRPHVGLGPSAASKVGASRGGNAAEIGAYLRRVAAEGHALAWRETLSPRRRLGETWWLGLRLTVGVDPAEARETAEFAGELDPALERAGRLAGRGLLEQAQGRWRLTPRGSVVADAVAAEFIGLPGE